MQHQKLPHRKNRKTVSIFSPPFRMRRAFGIAELIFYLIIFTVILSGIFYFTKNMKENANVIGEDIFKERLERAIKLNFNAILDAYAEQGSKVASDSTTSWGWSNNGLNQTSPFPSFNTSQKELFYRVSKSGITSTKYNNMKNAIIENLSGVCKPTAVQPNNGINFVCARITSMSFSPSYGIGANIDPYTPPVATVKYKRVHSYGNVSSVETYRFSMNDIYEVRRAISLSRLYALKKGVESFYAFKRSAELKNSPPAGLASDDDIVVPWHWEIFGDNKSSLMTAVCVISATQCTNLNTNNIWRSGTVRRGLAMRRVVSNLFGENAGNGSDYTIDGFNNAIYYHPFGSACSGVLSSCSITTPPVPRDDYLSYTSGATQLVPPFSGVFYTDACNDLTVSASSSCRIRANMKL